MKLDARTLAILKNFSQINPSLLFKEGSELRTISPSKTILAKAKVPAEFDKRFAIYNLSRFISTISLFSDPELKFGNKSVKMSDGSGKTISYTYAEETTIRIPPEEDIKWPSTDVSFTLTDSLLKEVLKIQNVLSLPEIAVVGDGSKLYIKAMDSGGTSTDEFSIVVGDTDMTFTAIFKSENVSKILSGDYVVNISKKKISHFVGRDVEYWIAIEADSTL